MTFFIFANSSSIISLTRSRLNPPEPSPFHGKPMGWKPCSAAANGVTVLHILPTDEAKPHEMTQGAKTADGTVTFQGPPTLFDLDGP